MGQSLRKTVMAALVLATTLVLLPFAAQADSEEFGMGSVPDTHPALSIHDANEGSGDVVALSELPDSYSSEAAGKVSPVKSQGSFDTCWSFAMSAAAESAALASGILADPDFSERHLEYFAYHPATDPLGNTAGDATAAVGNGDSDEALEAPDPYLFCGGNPRIVGLTWASWLMLVPEAVAPYGELTTAYDEHGNTEDFYKSTKLADGRDRSRAG